MGRENCLAACKTLAWSAVSQNQACIALNGEICTRGARCDLQQAVIYHFERAACIRQRAERALTSLGSFSPAAGIQLRGAVLQWPRRSSASPPAQPRQRPSSSTPARATPLLLKPPVIDPFNPFGTPAEDPMHGHAVAASHLTTDHLDVLARLASKLKHMRLEDIEQVIVIGLSDHDLELQVMTCEDEECVSVLVPVEFIAPCCQADEEGYEECVLDNLMKLDENLEPDPEEECARPSARYVRNDLQRSGEL